MKTFTFLTAHFKGTFFYKTTPKLQKLNKLQQQVGTVCPCSPSLTGTFFTNLIQLIVEHRYHSLSQQYLD